MLSRPQGHRVAGRIMSMTNSIDTIGNRTRDLPACSAVPQTTAATGRPWIIIVVTLFMEVLEKLSKGALCSQEVRSYGQAEGAGRRVCVCVCVQLLTVSSCRPSVLRPPGNC